jgi:pyruvate dehydrogenase E1 component alpha subunit/2-oxoisovalerate dehydrogenase E1 component alpha subunit
VYQATKRAVDRARDGGGVTLVELITYRRKGHAEHDNQSYVPQDELEAWEARDPIDRYQRLLTDRGWATGAELEGIERRVAEEIDHAVAACENEPLPDAESALGGVLHQPPSAPLEWYRSV